LPGAAWASASFPLSQKALAKKLGLPIASILYDIIPYSRPAFAVPALGRDFEVYLRSIVRISEIIIPISKYVATQLSLFSRSLFGDLVTTPSIKPVPLARQIPLGSHNPDHADMQDVRSRIDIDWRSFILNVGTIEVRKNHISLFVAWRLLAAMLREECPQLVLVGRQGWHVDAFYHSLDETNYLGGKIKILHGLSDEELTELYSQCLITVYPSIEEGWGLPIGESLDAGKLCISSHATSMPEAGMDLCMYTEPHEPLEMANKILEVLGNPSILDEYQKRIANAKPFRSWSDYKTDVASVLIAHAQSLAKSAPHVLDSANHSNSVMRDGEIVNYYKSQSDEFTFSYLASSSFRRLIEKGARKQFNQQFCVLNGYIGRNIVNTLLFSNEVDVAWAAEPGFAVSFILEANQQSDDGAGLIGLSVFSHQVIQ